MQKTHRTKALKTKRATKLRTAADNRKSDYDVQGSYTGIDLYDMFDEPVQDADDL